MDNKYNSWVYLDLNGYITGSSDTQLLMKRHFRYIDKLPSFIVVRINTPSPEALYSKHHTFFYLLKKVNKGNIICEIDHSLIPYDLIKELVAQGFSYIVRKGELNFRQMIEMCNEYKSYISVSYQSALLKSVQNIDELITDSERRNQNNKFVVHRWKAKPLFTNRELDVLECIIKVGPGATDIGKELHISTSTVKNYKSNLINKLKANNMTHLITKCIQRGIIDII